MNAKEFALFAALLFLGMWAGGLLNNALGIASMGYGLLGTLAGFVITIAPAYILWSVFGRRKGSGTK